MKREEIINDSGYQLTREAIDYIKQREFADCIDCFEAGAEWMQKRMIDKACEWIIENMPHYVSKDYTYEVDMADDFRKAMEE